MPFKTINQNIYISFVIYLSVPSYSHIINDVLIYYFTNYLLFERQPIEIIRNQVTPYLYYFYIISFMFEGPTPIHYSQHNPEVDQNKSECLICNQYCLIEEMGSVSDCSHIFCLECLKYYMIYRIKNQFALIECPREGCSQNMDTQSKVFLQLNVELRQRYHRIMNNINILRQKTQKNCPDCAIQLEKADKDNYLFCQKCLVRYCPKCLCKAHPKYKDCERYIVQFMKRNYKFKRCPRCLFMIEKKEGCIHMTCVCRYQFCYKCGTQWKGYDHICPEIKQIKPLVYHPLNRVIPQKQVFKMNVINLTYQNFRTQTPKNSKINKFMNRSRAKPFQQPVPRQQVVRSTVKTNNSLMIDPKY